MRSTVILNLLWRQHVGVCLKRHKSTAIYGTKHYVIQSDGQVAWQWAYSALGDEKPTTAKTRFANADLNQSFGTTAVPAVTFNLRYPGQYYDQESNLHYNYHRSYSATVGRYTQADPIGLDGGWNRFGYAEQNPNAFTDPLGEKAERGDDSLYPPTHNCSCVRNCVAEGNSFSRIGGFCSKVAGNYLKDFKWAKWPVGQIFGQACTKIDLELSCNSKCEDFCAGKKDCTNPFPDK